MTRTRRGQGQGGRKNMKRADRIKAIRAVLIAAQGAEPSENLTPYEIAHRCGLSNSTYFRDMLEQMYNEGEIFKARVQRPGRWPGFEYFIAGWHHYQPKPPKREIKLNGKVTLWS